MPTTCDMLFTAAVVLAALGAGYLVGHIVSCPKPGGDCVRDLVASLVELGDLRDDDEDAE